MDSSSLPGKWNLFDFTALPDFENWGKGKEIIGELEQAKEEAKKKQQIVKIIKFVAIFLLLLGLAKSFKLFLLSIVIIIICRKNGIIARKINEQVSEVEKRYWTAYYEHVDMFVAPLTKALVPDQSRSFRTGTKCIIYSGQRLVYYDVNEALLVAYKKENIKEVHRERLHTGASTSGNANSIGAGKAIGDTGLTIGGGTTKINSNTTNLYEWHFDVLTDFISYPKVSLVLEDSPNVEDFIGQAYAILKP